ncbi:MAG: ATP-binding protein [Candidatus Pacearchaeota archaeon]|jgi:signal transduction histidine kinase
MFIIILIISSVFFWILYNDYKKEVFKHLETIKESKISHINAYFDREIIEIKELSENERIIQYLSKFHHDNISEDIDEELEESFEEEIKLVISNQLKHTELEEISILTNSGIIDISSDINEKGKIKNNEAYFEKGKNGLYLQYFYYDLASSKITTSMSYPIKNEDNETIGVLVVKLNLNKLSELMIDSLGLGSTGETFLVNKFNYVLTDLKKLNNTESNKRINTVAVNDCIKGNSDKKSHFRDYNNDYVIASYDWIESRELCIIAKIDEKEAYEDIFELIFYTIIIAIISIIISGFFIYLFSRIVSNPLKLLEKDAEDIGKGKFDSDIIIKSNDEIGLLSKSIRKMKKDLKDYQEKLIDSEKRKNQELESEVKSKTTELNSRIEDLSMTKSAILNIMEDMTHANENLKELDKAKSEFLNIVSHELKTPLTAMIAHLDVLDDLKGNLTEDELNSIEAIRRNSENLKDLISNILEISRIESGKFELTKSKQEIDKIILDGIKRIEILSKQKGLKMIAKIEDLPKVNIDDTRFKEVMNNLLTNAIKFTDEGTITIKAKKKEDKIEIKVIDTGVGIPANKIDNLFQKFYQVDASISRRYGGTGLGLSITKKIIEAHGGNISVESDGVNKGTTFTLTLPID